MFSTGKAGAAGAAGPPRLGGAERCGSLHWAWLLVPLAAFNLYDGFRAWRCGVCRLRRMGINTPL